MMRLGMRSEELKKIYSFYLKFYILHFEKYRNVFKFIAWDIIVAFINQVIQLY